MRQGALHHNYAELDVYTGVWTREIELTKENEVKKKRKSREKYHIHAA